MSVFVQQRQFTDMLQRAEHVYWTFEGVTHVIVDRPELPGAPAARGKYHRFDWFALCGEPAHHALIAAITTDSSTRVTCIVCLDLMHTYKKK